MVGGGVISNLSFLLIEKRLQVTSCRLQVAGCKLQVASGVKRRPAKGGIAGLIEIYIFIEYLYPQ
jgi:hypothetical protein